MENNRHLSMAEVAEETGLSSGTVQRIMKSDLTLKKKTAKFVPRILTDEQKQCRMKMCARNLECLADDEDFLDFWR